MNKWEQQTKNVDKKMKTNEKAEIVEKVEKVESCELEASKTAQTLCQGGSSTP